MNRAFLIELADKCGFPAEGKEAILAQFDRIIADGHAAAFEAILTAHIANNYAFDSAKEAVEAFAAQTGYPVYTIWMLLLMLAAESARPAYRNDEVFWDSFSDFRAKLLECKDVHGVWGTFVSGWYTPRFYEAKILKLGRFEYERTTFRRETPYVCGNITVNPGDPVFSIHIPSSFGSLDEETRMDSYRKAYAYFRDELGDKPLVCYCHTWLFYPPYQSILPVNSNIRGFYHDFDLIDSTTTEKFNDAWRVFGGDHEKAPADLPERTSMQRAFKQYILDGGSAGSGYGMIIFDGEKILNKKG